MSILPNPLTPSQGTAAFILSTKAFADVYGVACMDQISACVDTVHPPITTEGLTPDGPEWLDQVEFLFTGWGAPRLDADLLGRMPRLRAVFHGAGSIRNMVTEAFWERGILITTAAAANAVPVSEYTLAAILFGLKRVWHYSNQIKRGCDYPPETSLMSGAYGSTVGLVSLGLIGRLVADHLKRFDLGVAAHDPLLPREAFIQLGITACDLPTLFGHSDVVSVHAPLLRETTGMITGELLARMKPGATFINTGRGALVREDELCEVLQERTDLQAVLDVTCAMPPEPDSPLRRLPNVFLTPHIAGSGAGECQRMGRTMVEELHRFLKGEPLRYAVTPELAVSRA